MQKKYEDALSSHDEWRVKIDLRVKALNKELFKNDHEAIDRFDKETTPERSRKLEDIEKLVDDFTKQAEPIKFNENLLTFRQKLYEDRIQQSAACLQKVKLKKASLMVNPFAFCHYKNLATQQIKLF